MKLAFEHCVADYAVHRPGYPPEVFVALEDIFGPAAGRLAVDVGAGTGIATRLLSEAGYRVIAVEPGMAMLRRNRQEMTPACPAGGIEHLCARAESTPLADGTVDLVAVFQAFHWFNPPYALAEFARILKPRGGLVLCWNDRQADRNPFVAEYDERIRAYNPAYKREYRQQDWAAKIAADGRFTPTSHAEVAWEWRLSGEAFIGFTRSVSYIRNVLSRQTRPAFERDVRGLIERHFGDGMCRVPIRTRLWWARRI